MDMTLAHLSNLWRSHLGQVLKQGKSLDHMSPVLSGVRQPLPNHVHDLPPGQRRMRQFRYLVHQGCVWSPLVVACRFSHFDLRRRIILNDVFDGTSNGHRCWRIVTGKDNRTSTILQFQLVDFRNCKNNFYDF